MTEAMIENQFVRRCEAMGYPALKLRIDGQKGFPDRTVFPLGGSPIFLEFKTPTGKLSAQQIKWHQRLRDLGYHVYVVRSVEEALCILEDHLS